MEEDSASMLPKEEREKHEGKEAAALLSVLQTAATVSAEKISRNV